MYYYEQTPAPTTTFTNGSIIWTIVSVVLAVIGGIVLYYMFFKPEKEVQNKYLLWLKEFFSFKKMLIEDMLKIIYTILALFITLWSFTFITVNFFSFLAFLIIGNIVIRVVFESILLNVMIWKNTNDINKKMKSTPMKETKKKVEE